MLSKLDLNTEFKTALDKLEHSQDSLFITGKAGTGKSTLLQYFKTHTQKRVVVLAPTGVSALNVQGETIHSFFKFKINVTPESAAKQGAKIKNTDFLEMIDTIVIDEVSMLRADMLDCIDQYLQAALADKRPFAAKQMVFIGDLYQLPPVVTHSDRDYISDRYDSPFFFSGDACKHLSLSQIHLEKIYRQQDPDFIQILNEIRQGSISPLQLASLNQSVVNSTTPVTADYIWLCSTNAQADKRNQEALAQLHTKEQVFEAESSGRFDEKRFPTEPELKLKVGAKVMFLNNDSDDRWVNGSIGEISQIDTQETSMQVILQNGQQVTVEPHKWELYRYTYDAETKKIEQEKMGDFRQFPLKLAWAMTIHKSQGKTFEKVYIDFGYGTFASGQAYVALSRCCSLAGLRLKQPLTLSHLRVDTRVQKWLTREKMQVS
ncbi:MAG: AAA family ATPase [bacterium]